MSRILELEFIILELELICRVTSFVPNDGCLNFIDENDGTLMIAPN